MSDLPENITWLNDVDRARIGIQIVEAVGKPLVKLILPDHGTEKTIDRAGAARHFQLLQNGVTFSKMLGDGEFSLLLNEIPSVE